MDINDITPDQVRTYQEREIEILKINLKQVNQAAFLGNEIAIKCINDFELPEFVQNALVATASNILDVKKIVNNLAQSYKTVSDSYVNLFETNQGLTRANQILADTLPSVSSPYDSIINIKDLRITELQAENKKLKYQSFWSFVKSKFK